jgi:hypothetical protein
VRIQKGARGENEKIRRGRKEHKEKKRGYNRKIRRGR